MPGMKRTASILLSSAMAALLLIAPSPSLHAQQPDQRPMGRGRFAGMQRVGGEITAVAAPNLTVKTEEGNTVQVVTTDNTRMMKSSGEGRGPGSAVTVKLTDLKPGDGVMAMGQLDDSTHTLHAAMLFATDAAVLQQMRENLGKTYITGRVTAIDVDNARMTVERPDHVSQTIGFDETTSFRRGRGRRGMMGGGAQGGPPPAAPEGQDNSITLADIHVGDNVSGRGFVKNGTFVPTELVVSPPRRREAGSQPPAGNPAP